MTQRELKQRIMDDPDLTRDEKAKLFNALRAPYVKMSDEGLLRSKYLLNQPCRQTRKEDI